VIGRSNQAKIKLRGSTVSRQHCELYEYEGQLVVRDLESSNGTIVNGHRIEAPTFLTPDDLLTVGPVTLRATCHETPLDDTASRLSGTVEKEAAAAAPKETLLPSGTSDDARTTRIEAEVNDTDIGPTGTDDAPQEGESVLSYSEDPDGSFVEIGNADGVSDIPVFDGLDAQGRPKVDTDDSALSSFLDRFE